MARKNRQKWVGALGGALSWAGLALAQPAPALAADLAERTVLVQETGRPAQQCKVLQSWTTPDGAVAHKVRALDTGELMTMVESPASGNLPGRTEAGRPQTVATRVYRWGGSTTPPAGTPVPPEPAREAPQASQRPQSLVDFFRDRRRENAATVPATPIQPVSETVIIQPEPRMMARPASQDPAPIIRTEMPATRQTMPMPATFIPPQVVQSAPTARAGQPAPASPYMSSGGTAHHKLNSPYAPGPGADPQASDRPVAHYALNSPYGTKPAGGPAPTAIAQAPRPAPMVTAETQRPVAAVAQVPTPPPPAPVPPLFPVAPPVRVETPAPMPIPAGVEPVKVTPSAPPVISEPRPAVSPSTLDLPPPVAAPSTPPKVAPVVTPKEVVAPAAPLPIIKTTVTPPKTDAAPANPPPFIVPSLSIPKTETITQPEKPAAVPVLPTPIPIKEDVTPKPAPLPPPLIKPAAAPIMPQTITTPAPRAVEPAKVPAPATKAPAAPAKPVTMAAPSSLSRLIGKIAPGRRTPSSDPVVEVTKTPKAEVENPVVKPASTQAIAGMEPQVMPAKVESGQASDHRLSWGKGPEPKPLMISEADGRAAKAPSLPVLPHAETGRPDPLLNPKAYVRPTTNEKPVRETGIGVASSPRMDRIDGPRVSPVPAAEPGNVQTSFRVPAAASQQPAPVVTIEADGPIPLGEEESFVVPLGTRSAAAAYSGVPAYLPVPVVSIPPVNPPAPQEPPTTASQPPERDNIVDQTANAFSAPAAMPMSAPAVATAQTPNAFSDAIPTSPVPAPNAYAGMGRGQAGPMAGHMVAPVYHSTLPRPVMPASGLVPASHVQAAPDNRLPTRDPRVMAHDARAIQQAIAILRDSLYPSQRETAADLLACVDGAANPAAVDALIKGAKDDPAGSVRAACIRGLGRMKGSNAAVVNTLQALQNDRDPRIRTQADLAIESQGKGGQTVVPAGGVVMPNDRR